MKFIHNNSDKGDFMKKILSLLLLCIIAPNTINTGYIAQNGPLVLGDQIQISPLTLARSIKRGIIMNTIITDPDFRNDLTNMYQFLNLSMAYLPPSYEEIVDMLQVSTNNSGSIAIIEAFEKAIMKYLHYNHYLCCVEGKNINIFFTGIKYNWFYPSAWADLSNWTSSCNSPEIAQLMNELEQLANIASKHSIATSIRLKAKINSYRSWKANTLKVMGVLGVIGLYAAYKNR